MTPFGFLNLRAIGGQLAALVIVSILVLHLIITAIFLAHRLDDSHPQPWHLHSRFAAAAQLLGAAPTSERPRLLADVERAFPQLSFEKLAPASVPATSRAEDRALHHLLHLPTEYRVVRLSTGNDSQRLAVVLPDGEAVAATVPQAMRPGPFWGSPLMNTLMFAVICVTLLGLWAARALARPLSSFAKAAESFSLDGTSAALPERGPEEIRAVAKALNRMRQRITGLIDDRTRMLAAISHDLRTPLTRMRLRTEFIEDDISRGRMQADLDQMLSMLESVLSFLRNDRRLESFTLVDVASTLQLVSDQFSDMGRRVSYVGPDHAMAMGRPDDLRRGVTNLVENAVRFGAEVTISLTLCADSMTIDVADDGPGISDANKASMLEPFVRGDDARNMDDECTGFGLGLSIARAIALAHGGELSLHDRAPQGLVVRMQIPLRAIPSRAQGKRNVA
ncbi:ATP-binding protein [Bradyrhizobium sp. ARR65]|uniref:ATP-binding protein n=1 Tax=Bradyrhizobium sp. ARR65 TaxID=1040989 RepID=UPI00046694FA|nr:ATP-binding protein [Bradyrhizobium sp. ARR65]